MADSVIGALRVVLGLDTAAFSSGAKEAQSVLDGMARTFKTSLAALGVGALAKQFADSIQHTIDAADEMGKASQKFGVPVEQLSALKYAADLADVSFESMGKGLGKLSKALLDGAVNPAGDAAKSFRALGVSTRDAQGNIKTSGEAFSDIAAKFATMEDASAKTAVAIRIFGKSGADLIPLLNEGRTGIEQLTAEAQRLGIVISEDTAKKAEIFNDNLKRIHATTQAVYLQIAQGLLPKLDELSQRYADGAKAGDGFKQVGEFIGDTLDKVYRAGSTVAQVFGILVDELKALNDVASTWPFTDARAAATANLNKVFGESAQKLQALKDGLATLPQSLDAFGDVIGGLPVKISKGFGGINEAALASKNAIDSFIQSQEKSIASVQAQAATLGAAVGVQEAMRVSMEATAIAKANDIMLTDAQRVAIKNLSDQAGAAAIALKGAQLTQEFLSPWDLYQQKLRDINILLREQAINANTASKAGAKAASQMTDVYAQAAATASGNFAEFFNTFAQGNAEMFAIGKAFSISQAIINTYQGATKALADLPPPLSYVAAAGVIAAGLAHVATIVAQKPTPKMALGGSFMLTGAGGTDSQMVPIMATPGERVSIDQNQYGEGANKTYTVQGLKPKDYYRGDVLRDILDNVNKAVSDGYKLKLA